MESADPRGLLRSVASWIEYVKLRLAEILVLRGQDTPVIRATRGAYQFVGHEALSTRDHGRGFKRIDGWNTNEKSWSLALKTSFPGGCARFWHALHAAGFKRRRQR
jgi:hypothetical protein